MTEHSYEDAVQVLRQQLNNRWDGREAEGREAMVSILTQSLGYNTRDAESTIDAMIRAGTIRYYTLREEATAQGDTTDQPGIIAAGPQVSGSAGLPAAPIAPGADFAPGYWEIGRDSSDEIGGRSGQVTPR